MSTVEQEPRAHARLAPSSAAQWRRCPGSVTAEEQYEDITGQPAAEGTLFHEFAEVAFSCGFEPWVFKENIGSVFHIDGHDITFTQDMISDMYAGLDWLNEQVEDDAFILTEERVKTSTYTLEDGGFGTSDNIIALPTRRRIITQDWKYGRVAVTPIGNDQMTIYTLGFWDDRGEELFGDPEGVEVWFKIDQPRANGGGGIWKTTMSALLKEGDQIIKDAQRVWEEPDLRIPGSTQCLFCKHAINCDELTVFNLEKAQMDFDDLDDYDFEATEEEKDEAMPERTMSAERRSAFLAHWPALKRWYDKLAAEALEDALADRDVPNYKVVEGRRGSRKVIKGKEKTYERVLAQNLDTDAYKISPLTPAAAETELGRDLYKKLIAPYVEQSDGKPQLVLSTDNRDAAASIVDRFDEL